MQISDCCGLGAARINDDELNMGIFFVMFPKAIENNRMTFSRVCTDRK